MDNTHLYTDAEIFGFIKQRRLAKNDRCPITDRHEARRLRRPRRARIARFSGVTTMLTDSTHREYLVLRYAHNDMLYVPTDQIDRVSRYIGATERPPALSRLGTQEWLKTREKVKEAAAEVARELLALYATREVVPGFAFNQTRCGSRSWRLPSLTSRRPTR